MTYAGAGRLHQRRRSRTRRGTPRSAGNPALKPTTADQLDLTYEWYFSSTGSFTAALFYKKFNDYMQYGNYIARVHQQRRDAARSTMTRSDQR